MHSTGIRWFGHRAHFGQFPPASPAIKTVSMTELSTKPYLIRAIYEWCADAGFTPYIGVHVDQNTRVPMEYVKNGEIVLSISMQATRDLTIGNDMVQFSARFGGVSREIAVPIYAVASIFARENGKGMYFEPESPPLAIAPATPTQPSPQPALQSVPNMASAPAAENHESGVNTDDAGSAASDHEAAAPSSTAGTEGAGANAGGDKPKGPPRGKLRVIK